MVGPKVPLTDYLGVEGGRLRGIDQILARASSDLGKQIRGLKVVDEETAMTRIQLRAQQSAIKAHLDQDWKDIAAATDAGQREAVVAASRTISKYENEMWTLAGVPQADLKAMADMEAKRAARSVRTMMDREQASLRPLAGSVYRAKAVANGFVDNAVNSALSRGLSVDQFASEVEKLISPTTPGGVSYAARRLARTEINNAYHAGSKRRYDESGMVDFIEWHKSSSHPEGDECDDLEANSPYDADKVPDKPHPQCLCYVTPGLPDQEEFLRNVLSDKYGRQKSFIEEVAPEAITAAALGTVAIRVAPYAFRYVKRRILKSSLQPGPKIALKALNSSASREEIADALSVARAAARKAQRDQLEEIVRRAAETGDDIRDIAQQVKPVGGQQVTPTSGGARITAIDSLRDRLPTGKIAANDLSKKTVDNTVKAPRKAPAPAKPFDPMDYDEDSPEMIAYLEAMEAAEKKAAKGLTAAQLRPTTLKNYGKLEVPTNTYKIPTDKTLKPKFDLDDLSDKRPDYVKRRFQMNAIEEYTEDSTEINSLLRSGADVADNDTYNGLMSLIGEGVTDRDILVTRGIGGIRSDEFLPGFGADKASWVGRTFEDKAFVSTSASRVPVYGEYHLNIHIPKGSKAAYLGDLSKYPEQRELLLPPGTKFKVVGVRDVKYTNKQLGPEFADLAPDGLAERTVLDVVAVTDDAIDVAKAPVVKTVKEVMPEYVPKSIVDYNRELMSPQDMLDALDLMDAKSFGKVTPRTIDNIKKAVEGGDRFYHGFAPDFNDALTAAKRIEKARLKKAAAAPVTKAATTAAAKAPKATPTTAAGVPELKPVRLKAADISEEMLAEKFPFNWKEYEQGPLPKPKFPKPESAVVAKEYRKIDQRYYDEVTAWSAYERSVSQSGPAGLKALRARYISEDLAAQRDEIRRLKASADPTVEPGIVFDIEDLFEEEQIIERRLRREYKKAVLSIRDDYPPAPVVDRKKFLKRGAEDEAVRTDIGDGFRAIQPDNKDYGKHAREVKAMREYAEDKYVQMNEALRLGKSVSPEIQGHIDEMLKLTGRNALKADTILTRGVPKSVIDDEIKKFEGKDISDLMGQTLSDDGFISTDFGTVPMWGSYQFEILAPKGTRGMNVSAYNPSLESEFVMQPKTKFKVVGLRDHVFSRAEYAADDLTLDPYDGYFKFEKKTIITVIAIQDE